VFSSTSSVYGEIDLADLPTKEWHSKDPLTSYGSSKLCCEHMLRDVDRAFNIKSVSLRYFNASGANPDASIGEFRESPNHLIPSLAAVALGKREEFVINGTDYDTPDGTSIRDYTHVWDIARAHVMALNYLDNGGASTAINIGAGEGKSVSEVLAEFQKQWGSPIFFREGPRRPGDIPMNYADISKAKELLGWKPEISSTEKIVEDAIRWYRSELFMRLSNV
jgi:UDP-glucose 4-epimerase